MQESDPAAVPGTPHPLSFTDRQNEWITGSITLVTIALAASVLWWLLAHVSLFIGRYRNILLPPVAAIVLAMICRPLYDRLRRSLWGSHALGLAAVSIIVFVPFGLFCWLFGALAIRQALNFLGHLPAFYDRIHEAMVQRMPELQTFLEERGMPFLLDRFSPETWMDDILRQLGGTAYSVGFRAVEWIGGLLGWIVLPIYTAFFLATRPLDGSDVRKLLVFATPKTRDSATFLVDQFLGIVVVFFRGQVLVAAIQGVLFGIGFQLIGLEYGLLIGLCLGLLNVIPYLGNAVGLSVTVPMALFGARGGPLRLLWVMLIFAAVQSLESYIITPRVMGNRTGLSAFVVIFSLLFWNAVIGGVLGLLLAIPLSAFLMVFWRLLKREYFPHDPDAFTEAGVA